MILRWVVIWYGVGMFNALMAGGPWFGAALVFCGLGLFVYALGVKRR